MSIVDRHVARSTIQPKRSAQFRRDRYAHAFAYTQTLPLTHASGVTALPTAGAAQIDFFDLGSLPVEMYQTTAQTLLPILSSSGLEIALDQVNNESVEYALGGNNALNPFAHVVGTSKDVFLRAKFNITDASGSDQFLLGWRKQEAFAVPTSFLAAGDGIYTDFCGIGFCAAAADPNTVRCANDLNNGGSTTVGSTAFTWADTLTHVLEMRVSAAGVVKFFINGVPMGSRVSKSGTGAAIIAQDTTVPFTFTFDSTDTLVPFIFVRQDADLTPIYLLEVELGDLDAVL